LVLTGVSHPVLYCASYASSSLTVCSYSFIIKSKYFQNIKSCELIPSFMFCCFSINCVPSFVTSFAWTSSLEHLSVCPCKWVSMCRKLFWFQKRKHLLGYFDSSSFIDRRISFFHFTHWVFFIWRPDNSRNTVFRNSRGFRGDWVSETLVDS
jgi:hypothetical protein